MFEPTFSKFKLVLLVSQPGQVRFSLALFVQTLCAILARLSWHVLFHYSQHRLWRDKYRTSQAQRGCISISVSELVTAAFIWDPWTDLLLWYMTALSSGFCSCCAPQNTCYTLHQFKICVIDHHCNSTHNVLSAAVTGPWTHDGKLTSKCWEICLMLFKIYDTVLLYQQHTNLYISTTGSRFMLCWSPFTHNHSFQLHYMMGKERKRGEVMGSLGELPIL